MAALAIAAGPALTGSLALKSGPHRSLVFTQPGATTAIFGKRPGYGSLLYGSPHANHRQPPLTRLGIADRIPDVLVPQIILDQPCIGAQLREEEPAGMP